MPKETKVILVFIPLEHLQQHQLEYQEHHPVPQIIYQTMILKEMEILPNSATSGNLDAGLGELHHRSQS